MAMNMNPLRKKYVEEISDALKYKAFSNRVDAGANDFNFTRADEAFFAELLNFIFNYELSATELIKKNYPAIDLVDNMNKVIVQVTYSIGNDKLQHSISHKIIQQYTGYTFIYFYTGDEDLNDFKNKSNQIANPYALKFTRSKNIFGISDIISKISNDANISTYTLSKIRDLFPKTPLTEVAKIHSQLTKVINILKVIKRNFDISTSSSEHDVSKYDIPNKINYNNLIHYEECISEYSPYRDLLQGDDGIYKISYEEVSIVPKEIYSKIKTYYIEAMINYNPNEKVAKNGDEIFISVFSAIKKDIKSSQEYEKVEEELLDDCLYIILIDAFIECKWFVKPPKTAN